MAPLYRRLSKATSAAVAALLAISSEASRLGIGSQVATEAEAALALLEAEGNDPKGGRSRYRRPQGTAIASRSPRTTQKGFDAPVSLVPPTYKSAGVLFYTRDLEGKVSHVLLGVRVRDVNLKGLGQDDDRIVSLPMLQIPMGERFPKKVEGWAGTKVGQNFYDTAQKWWMIETADAAGLSRYLEMAATGQRHGIKSCGGREGAEDVPPALYYGKARMALVFCEIGEPGEEPPIHGKKPQRKGLTIGPWKWSETMSSQVKGDSLFDPPRSWSERTEPRRRLDAEAKMAPDELRLTWVHADELRATLESGFVGGDISTSQGRHPLQPFSRELLMLSGTRRWLGINAIPSALTSARMQRKRSTKAFKIQDSAKLQLKSPAKSSAWSETGSSAKSTKKSSAKFVAKSEAKATAKSPAKSEARSTAKLTAKQTAKKKTAKSPATAEAKSMSKSPAKSEAKSTAKPTAKSTTKKPTAKSTDKSEAKSIAKSPATSKTKKAKVMSTSSKSLASNSPAKNKSVAKQSSGNTFAKPSAAAGRTVAQKQKQAKSAKKVKDSFK